MSQGRVEQASMEYMQMLRKGPGEKARDVINGVLFISPRTDNEYPQLTSDIVQEAVIYGVETLAQLVDTYYSISWDGLTSTLAATQLKEDLKRKAVAFQRFAEHYKANIEEVEFFERINWPAIP